ncbi:hypothetical protein BB561_004114 [Smittium simulii]|uniref:beta-glucosidase n=1 Tax=Smittium simulii TaxID=133385 RepID=A0A2T9YI20_9FUNG|nr:hypothetical protein BB561_004114 [Smittium simulii]
MLALASLSSSLEVQTKIGPTISITGPKMIGNTVCLPDNFSLQDFDPMRPKSVDTYEVPKFDESGFIGPSNIIDDDVLSLVNSLTLEQKVGQMTQIHTDQFIGCDGLMNRTAIEYYFSTYNIGSVLHLAFGSSSRFAYWSPQRFANLSNTMQEIALSTGSKIPILFGIDSLRGASLIKGAVIFPTAVSTAATFNRKHAYTCGRVSAKDTRAGGMHLSFGPSADININKLWSRNFENFGEDPYLAGEMAHYSVKGYQGNYKKDRSRVAACVKHFIAYPNTYNGKDQEPRYVPMNQVMEYHAPSFLKAFAAGSATAMETYGSLNGEDVISSKLILKTLLRETMKFNGTLISDYGEVISQYSTHKTAFDETDASYISINNTSLDLSMVGEGGEFTLGTIELVKQGKIPMSRIDESVGRLLQLKKDLGLFTNPFSDPALIDTVASKRDIEDARETARESIVLLKNENNFLPLKNNEKVLFIGTNINSTRYMGGGWNVKGNGPSDLEGDAIYDGYGDTILSGIESVTGKKPNWITGYDIEGNQVDSFDDIMRMARRADKIIFGFGENTKTEIGEKMKFNGTLISDYGEVISQYSTHKTAFDETDASYISINNTSLDLSMVGEGGEFTLGTIELVKQGKIPMSRIDESVGRLLQLKKDLGLFTNPFSDPALIDTVASKRDIEDARETARESIVLLKNENNFLPLKNNEKVLFIGTNINSTRYMGGGWNVKGNGPSDLEGDAIYDGYGDTILSGIESVTGKKPNWITGYDIEGNQVDSFDDIMRMARRADKIIFGFGENTKTEIGGDIESLSLNPEQYNIVKKIAVETTTPFGILLLQNRPFSLGKLSKYADSIVNALLPGAYGGLPVAEMLYGKYSPSGRMPYTYPRLEYQSSVTYYAPIWNEYDPEFAFGTGFGYNNITYSNITVSSNKLSIGNPVTISVTAHNKGDTPQKETVIMYTTQKIRRRYAPERFRVRDFDKKTISAGESVEYSFTLTAEELKFYTVELDHILEEGPVVITLNAGNNNKVSTEIYLNTK